MRSTIAAVATALVLALVACGGDSNDTSDVTDDPDVKATIEQLEENGAPQSQIDEVIDYAGDLDGKDRADYLETVRNMNEDANGVDELNAEIEREREAGCYDFNPDQPVNTNPECTD